MICYREEMPFLVHLASCNLMKCNNLVRIGITNRSINRRLNPSNSNNSNSSNNNKCMNPNSTPSFKNNWTISTVEFKIVWRWYSQRWRTSNKKSSPPKRTWSLQLNKWRLSVAIRQWIMKKLCLIERELKIKRLWSWCCRLYNNSKSRSTHLCKIQLEILSKWKARLITRWRLQLWSWMNIRLKNKKA